MKSITYYIRVIAWLWKHRDEKNYKAKYKRMAHDLDHVPGNMRNVRGTNFRRASR